MTTEGLKSLCLALQQLEAAEVATIQTPRAPGIRIVLVRRQDNQVRPRLVDFELKKKPVQTEFDWPTNQLRLSMASGGKGVSRPLEFNNQAFNLIDFHGVPPPITVARRALKCRDSAPYLKTTLPPGAAERQGEQMKNTFAPGTKSNFRNAFAIHSIPLTVCN